jgi:hypothetical protein
MTLASAQGSSLPYPQLRAAAAVTYQLPMIGVVLTCGDRITEVGTLLDGPDQVHPSDFRDLVSMALDSTSLDPLYSGLDLTHGQAIDVRLVSRSVHCVARPGGVIRAVGSSGPMYLFATDMWWPNTVSVLLDETKIAATISNRFGEIDPYLDIVQNVHVDSTLDDVMSISLITVRCAQSAAFPLDVVDQVTESIAQGLAERLTSLTILG